jgi:hypothetical protein
MIHIFCRGGENWTQEDRLTLEGEVTVQSIDSPPTPLSHLPWIEKEVRVAARQNKMDTSLDRISSQQNLWHCRYVDDVAKEGSKGEDSAQES